MLTKLFILAVAIMEIATTPLFGETAIQAMHSAYQDNIGGDIPLNFHLRTARNCQTEGVITRRLDHSLGTASGGRSRRSSDPQSCSCSGTCSCSGSCVCSGGAVCSGSFGGLWAAPVSPASGGGRGGGGGGAVSNAGVDDTGAASANEICEFCFCNATNAARYCERVDCTSATSAAKNSWNQTASLFPWSSINVYTAVPFQVYTVYDGFCYVLPIDAYTGRTMKCFARLQSW